MKIFQNRVVIRAVSQLIFTFYIIVVVSSLVVVVMRETNNVVQEHIKF